MSTVQLYGTVHVNCTVPDTVQVVNRTVLRYSTCRTANIANCTVLRYITCRQPYSSQVQYIMSTVQSIPPTSQF